MTRAAVTICAVSLMLVARAYAQHRFTVSPMDAEQGPSPRADHLAVVLQSSDGFLFIIHGGRDAVGLKSDTWTYLVAQNTWQLLAAPALSNSVPPPPISGAVGGYRFVEGVEAPFLYVAMGRLGNGNLTSDMWVMEFENFTWSRVEVDGDVPAPRFGAAGSLERFVKPDGEVQPAMIISHGFGEDGPLSDTYKCSFDPTDPYRATWRRMRGSVGQYSTRGPHPVWMQAATFTASRDLAVFGGCYASGKHGGVCPSRNAWLLDYESENTAENSGGLSPPERPDDPSDVGAFELETDSVSWTDLPNGPGPRVGAVMAQGLKSFEGAYANSEGIAVLYSGLQTVSELPVDHMISATGLSGEEIDILSTASKTWLRERVHYNGPRELRSEVLAPRRGATLSIVRSRTGEEEDEGEPDDASNEFFLLFGGQLGDDNFTNAMVRISFDAFVESERVSRRARYISRPYVHGILMFLSWGVLMVIGTFSSRYMKGENGRPRYMILHVSIQVIALILAWAGVGVVVYGRRRITASFPHARIGLALIILVSMQPVFAAVGVFAQLRNPPHPSVDPGEGPKVKLGLVPRICQLYHRVGGIILLFMGCLNITLGLFLLMAPTVLWVQWIVYSGLLLICMVWLEVIGKGGRLEHIQSRAASETFLNHGNSYLRRVVRYLKGETVSAAMRRSPSRHGVSNKGYSEGGRCDSATDLFALSFEKVAESSGEIPPEGFEVLSNLTELHKRNGLISEQGNGSRRLQIGNGVRFEEPSTDAPNLAAGPFRERRESVASSAHTYQDPDSY